MTNNYGRPNLNIMDEESTNENVPSLQETFEATNQNMATLEQTPSTSSSFARDTVDLTSSFTEGGIDPSQTSEFAQSAFGDLEMTKYLYESGLQNIFTDYQRNIQTLQQEQAAQLQNAYVAREMSKKYLGEYASNVGIGDVSGSLIDIYSQYAENISDIDQNFAALEMNLTREYTMQRMTTFENILRTQYQMEVAELDSVATEASQYVFTEFDDDVQGGLSYLATQQENMRPEDYEMVRDAYYQSNVENVKANLMSENPYFGFADLESRTLKSQEQYLQEVRQWMEPDEYREIEEMIALQEVIASNEGEIDFGDPLTDIDPALYSTDPLVTSESEVYQLENNNFAVATQSIVGDDVAFNASITPQLLNSQFEEQSGRSAAEASEGDIVQYQGFYILKQGEWHRMINIGLKDRTLDTLTPDELRTWSVETDTTPARGVQIDRNFGEDGETAITIGTKTFVEDESISTYKRYLRDAIFRNREGDSIPMEDVVKHLNETFLPEGESKPNNFDEEVLDFVPKGQIFEYEGQYYIYTEDGKKIRPMRLQEEEQAQ